MPEIITRFLTLILLATSVAVTLVLMFLGYEVALLVMEGGHVSGQTAMVTLAAFPSLFALGALPFWMVWRRMSQRVEIE